MNDESPTAGQRGSRRRPGGMHSKDTTAAGLKRPPRLELSVEIEGAAARIRICAESAEDEAAIVAWLRRKPRVIARLADVETLLEQLDRRAA